MATSQQLLLVAAAVALVLLVGSADATGCPRGYKNCNPKKPDCETNTDSDIYNCGDCHKKCHHVYGADTKCYGGHCKYPCKKWYGDCDRNPHNGCEKNLKNDIYNCGQCRNKCICKLRFGEATCNYGKCGEQCKKGWTYHHEKKICYKSH